MSIFYLSVSTSSYGSAINGEKMLGGVVRSNELELDFWDIDDVVIGTPCWSLKLISYLMIDALPLICVCGLRSWDSSGPRLNDSSGGNWPVSECTDTSFRFIST